LIVWGYHPDQVADAVIEAEKIHDMRTSTFLFSVICDRTRSL